MWLSYEITTKRRSNFLSLCFRNILFSMLDLTSPALKLFWFEGALRHSTTVPLWKLSSQSYCSVLARRAACLLEQEHCNLF